MVKVANYVCFNYIVEFVQVYNKTGGRIAFARNCDFEFVVVTVPVRMPALAEDARVFRIRQGWIDKAMRR